MLPESNHVFFRFRDEFSADNVEVSTSVHQSNNPMVSIRTDMSADTRLTSVENDGETKSSEVEELDK